ncbi:DUF5996 family protein [Arthrobacter sp. SLBN-112]|uniref:DUF5996 family protein n=1 Tax=Arthrobacter sp. SLBN-112 TaxID=2768452 RepID=UPI0027B48332|nr:DUF5996 family protein [Arthrobacter sp. SLBN-112]MDQ0799037.1 hypothetical protein [Arthrobacter sp. SLBN-112]
MREISRLLGMGEMNTDGSGTWPYLPTAQWQDTRDTLQLFTQMVGKVSLAHSPLVNHWWNCSLRVTARGLSTVLMPHPGGQRFQIDLDFQAHRLEIVTTSGAARSFGLVSLSVADFYTHLLHCLSELNLTTEFWPVPVEISGAVPFPDDSTHASYDPEPVRRFWLILVEAERVFTIFRGRFLGKASPVQLFWGSLDLAVSRFSGRPAPPHPGGAPNCGPLVMLEAYSHEVNSAGYWPGGGPEGIFFSYIYPEPEGFRDFPIRPAGAYFSTELSEFVLPYALVRTAEDPEATLLEFLQSTYEAAAICASWDRAALERRG